MYLLATTPFCQYESSSKAEAIGIDEARRKTAVLQPRPSHHCTRSCLNQLEQEANSASQARDCMDSAQASPEKRGEQRKYRRKTGGRPHAFIDSRL